MNREEEKEQWKDIEGYEGLYQVSDKGRVKTLANDKYRKEKIRKPRKDKDGYLQLNFTQNKVKKTPKVHRLVAEAFIPNPDNKPCVDHKDGNRQNNKLANLRWATYSENNSRFNTLGVRSEKIRVTHYRELRNKRGGGHIEWLDVDNIQYFDRIIDAANHFAVTQGNITPLLKSGKIGVRGKMRGYKFEYCKSSMNV